MFITRTVGGSGAAEPRFFETLARAQLYAGQASLLADSVEIYFADTASRRFARRALDSGVARLVTIVRTEPTATVTPRTHGQAVWRRRLPIAI